jgi:hypothetical protein
MVSIESFAIAIAGVEDMGDRLVKAAWLTHGNIVEIGGGEGLNTIQFLKIARERKHEVIVVDPFEQIPGADESYFKDYSFEKFTANIESKCSDYLLDHLRIIELPSQDNDMVNRLKYYFPIGFMFIDGLQDRLSVLSDLRLAEALNVEIICVDDYDRLTPSSQVPRAVSDFIETTNYKFINIGKREAYFIK